RAAELLAEELDARGPVRVSEVETQQRKILQVVRNLAASGQIVIGGKAEYAYV
ncbi:FliG C-terminal domain-containing protein, partial [Burkholderia pseudomallei]